jgi:hypothetical protein
MGIRQRLRKILDAEARVQPLVRPKNPLLDYSPAGGVLSPSYNAALESELWSVVPEEARPPEERSDGEPSGQEDR